MKTKNKNLILINLISTAIMCIYPIFILMDISYTYTDNNYSTYLKFSCIILCFIISLLIGRNGFNPKDVFLLKLARFFTVIADYFLLLSNNYILGVLSFCVVQLIYIKRHSLMWTTKSSKKITPFIFLDIFILILILLSLIFHIADTKIILIITSIFYGFLLIISVYCGIKTLNFSFYTKRSSLFISWGIILFFLCDINVGFYQLIEMSFFPNILHNFQFAIELLIWTFYLPSQLLLTLSGIDNSSLVKLR